jgi:hypothetical protein
MRPYWPETVSLSVFQARPIAQKSGKSMTVLSGAHCSNGIWEHDGVGRYPVEYWVKEPTPWVDLDAGAVEAPKESPCHPGVHADVPAQPSLPMSVYMCTTDVGHLRVGVHDPRSSGWSIWLTA